MLRSATPVGSVLALVPAMGCGGGTSGPAPAPPPPPPPGGVATVAISPDTATLTTFGAATQFAATARDANGATISGVAFSWRSSDPSVVTVDGAGTATAEANGGAAVEAQASGHRASARVAVRAGPLAWAEVRAGLFHSCGVTTHGTAYCWGDNAHGEIGNGGTAQVVPLPEAVVGGILFFERFTLGGGQTCARTTAGDGYCWGNTAFGEGGFGQTTDVWTDPTPISGGIAFRQLSAGGNHTCGAAEDGTAYCWGLNEDGQLGDATTSSRSTPVEVAGGHLFVQIDAASQNAGNHTCGVTSNGEAYCWGVNSAGELGDGSMSDSSMPVLVAGGLTFLQVSAGGDHSCGITQDGSAYCWGANFAGQLGDGSTQPSSSPVPVSGGFVFEVLSAAEAFTCGLTDAGRAYCWGINSVGQLGDGTTQTRLMPVEVTGSLNWVQIDTGWNHMCGLTTDGTGYCWGSNLSQKLGDGTSMERHTPHPLPHPDEIG